MMYRVLTDFSDMLDKGHVYRAGDEFPRSGVSVSEQRIRELASSSNRLGQPMIEAMSEKHVTVEEKTENIEAEEKNIEAEVEKPKRRRKKID